MDWADRVAADLVSEDGYNRYVTSPQEAMIGNAGAKGDDTQVLRSAIEYIERHSKG